MTDGIRLEGLVKNFGAVKAVRGVDITIAPGEVVALLGPNGAGKTTIIDMILGLLRPDGGQVMVFGKTPADAVHEGRVGGMLQTGTLINDLSVRELITMMSGLYPHPLDVDHVMQVAHIADLADRRGNKLSGGQIQRVRFAVALIANPDLIVLDEPTVALDVEGRRDFWAAMRNEAIAGKTILFATHYLEEADDFADRIILVARGQVVADGPGTEIKARVGMKTIRCTLAGMTEAQLTCLPGVSSAEIHGDGIILHCLSSDEALRALITTYPAAKDFEVRGAGLEEAFLALTEDAEDAELMGGQL